MKKANPQELHQKELISKLIHYYMGLIEKDENYSTAFNFTENYLINNSLTYFPQSREIEVRINSLLEKLEINSQFDKAKLLFDLISRLRTIFDNKNKDTLFNTLYILLQLAHSPLQTSIDIEVLRERFEERYIRHESNKIVRNLKFNFNPADIQFERTVDFEPVDYNEPSSEYSDNSCEEIKIQTDSKINFSKKEEIKDQQQIIPKSKILSRKILCKREEDFYDYDNFMMETLEKKSSEKDKINPKIKMLEIYKKCFKMNEINCDLITKFPYLYKENNILLDHLFNVNARHDQNHLNTQTDIYFKLFLRNSNVKNCVSIDNLQNNYYLHYCNNYDTSSVKHVVDSDYILNLVLINLCSHTKDNDADKDKFLKTFNNFICLDLNTELIDNILITFNHFKDSLVFLKDVENSFEVINSVTIGKILNFVKEFLIYHDKILDSFIKLLNYQKGKISISNQNVLLIENNQNYQFVNELINEQNDFLQIHLQNNKFTIMKFYVHYQNNIVPIINYFVDICEHILKIKKSLTSLNKFSNTLYTKEVMDFIYSFTKAKFSLTNKKFFVLHLEVFFGLIEVYLRIIYEFIINGNLIDVNNEFFIDHLITKKENKKIIFNFNEKFKKFDWIDSFKIKAFSYKGVDGACVPLFLMINNLHFKILETSKSTFLIKNLKNYDKIDFELLLNENDNNVDLRNIKKILGQYLSEAKLFDEEIRVNNNNDDVQKIYPLPLKNKNNFYSNSEEKNVYFLNKQLKVKKVGEQNFLLSIPFALKHEHEHEQEITGKENNLKENSNLNKLNFNFVGEYEDLNYVEEETTNVRMCNPNNLNNPNNPNNIDNIDNIDKNTFRENYKSYFISKSGKIETNLEIESMKNLIEEAKLSKQSKQSNSSNSSNQYKISKSKRPSYLSFNLDHIIKKLIHSRILSINKIINLKLLSFLIDGENLLNHFELVFHLYLFKAGFSMNKFALEVDDCTKKKLPVYDSDNFYLKNLLNELCLNSDLLKFKTLIGDYVSLNFKENNGLYTINNSDFILMEYQPKLPVSIFFDAGVIANYNSIFNLILKIKRTNNVIKNIEVDKKLSNVDMNINMGFIKKECIDVYKKILKYFVNLRMMLMNFLTELEFYVFYIVIDQKIKKFMQKISTFKSIDSLINSHVKFIKEISLCLAIKDEKFIKTLLKILNLINNYNFLLNKFILIENENNKLEKYENIFSDIFNFTERFKNKQKKFQPLLNKYLEKAKN